MEIKMECDSYPSLPTYFPGQMPAAPWHFGLLKVIKVDINSLFVARRRRGKVERKTTCLSR
jgi:hypothetical protein